MNPPAIDIENLTLRYTDKPSLLTGFSMTVQPGEYVALQGESGCGKSTLLHCICGLIPRSIHAEMSGNIRLFGRPLTQYRRHELVQTVGIVFQNPETQLFCDTVEDEIAFGLENICLPREEMSLRINESLKLTGLEKYRQVSPRSLSGGQKQLVTLAAVLALSPRLLLLDEAFSQLDKSGKAQLLTHIAALRDSGVTIVLTDHNRENLAAAQRIIRIGGRLDE